MDDVINKMESYLDEMETLLFEIMGDDEYRSIDISRRKEIVQERTREEILDMQMWDLSEKSAERITRIINDTPQLKKY